MVAWGGRQLMAEPLDLSAAPVYMSSVEAAGLGDGILIFDHNATTRIATGNNGDGNDNEWIYFDMGNTIQLDEIRIDWEAAFGQDYDLLISSTNPGPTSAPTDPIWTKIAEIRGFDQDGASPPNHGSAIDNIITFTGAGSVLLPSDLGGAGTGSVLVPSPQGQYVMLHGINRGSEWGFSIFEVEVDGEVVPEPSSLTLLGGGFVVLIGLTKRYLRKNRD
jgi:hypothetical protein